MPSVRRRAPRGNSFDLNREAGEHPVTTDPLELGAAQRAASLACDEYPYYTARFGDRAIRFGVSDGAWLVTLCDSDASTIRHQLRWLGGVLSRRGMPQILLEHHLRILHDELLHACPERARHYAPLARAAASFRKMREETLPSAPARKIQAAFDHAVRGLPDALPRMAEILLSAVVDEACGIDGALDATVGWSTDERRYGDGWRNAVIALVGAARSAVERAQTERATGRVRT